MSKSVTIKSLVFALVFLTMMSVSFFVEASDVPDRAKELDLQATESYGPFLPEAVEVMFPTADTGMASWYGSDFHGRRTASGARFNMNELTAAHKTLPFGTLLRVVNEANGKTIVVQVTDRGPYIRRRIVDLSMAAARAIGVSVSPVTLEVLRPEQVFRHYANNDSTVLVITDDMDVQIRPAETLQQVEPAKSFTEAMKSLNETGVVVVLPGADGKVSFARAQGAPVDIAGNSTL